MDILSDFENFSFNAALKFDVLIDLKVIEN